MGLLSRLFGKASSANPDLRQQQKEAGIHHDPDLIAKLKEDHQGLFRAYGRLQEAYAAGDFSTVPQQLSAFKLLLQTHLMVENVKFYVYLQQNLMSDADLFQFVADVRREMDGIARVVIKFVAKYQSVPFYLPQTRSDFKKELDEIGRVLTARVQMEESRLYTLYLPSY